MKRIVLASANPVKVRATLGGFERLFPDERFELESVDAASGVGAQPRSDAETLRGAENRARGAAARRPEADFWVGIEGGVADDAGAMSAFAWVVVRSRRRRGRSRTASFALPDEVAALVRAGKELGEADDLVFGRTGSKRAEGAVGLLTGGVIDRRQLYEPAVVLALLPFRNDGLYPPAEPP